MKSTGPPPRSPGSISCKDKRGTLQYTLQYRRLRYYIYKCNPGGEISMEATITGDGFNIPERLVSKTPSPHDRSPQRGYTTPESRGNRPVSKRESSESGIQR